MLRPYNDVTMSDSWSDRTREFVAVSRRCFGSTARMASLGRNALYSKALLVLHSIVGRAVHVYTHATMVGAPAYSRAPQLRLRPRLKLRLTISSRPHSRTEFGKILKCNPFG